MRPCIRLELTKEQVKDASALFGTRLVLIYRDIACSMAHPHKRRLACLADIMEVFMKSKRSLGCHPLLYPEPALLVATYDPSGKPNAMIAAWGGICCSAPLCLTVSVRPGRWTYQPLLDRKAFTVCIASESMLIPADFAGMASGRKYDKFKDAGWTAVKAEKVDAPYIAESPVILECSLLKTIELGAHTMMVGQIMDVKADEDCLDPTGSYPDIHKVSPLIFDSGSRNYYAVGKLLGKAFSAGKDLMKKEEPEGA